MSVRITLELEPNHAAALKQLCRKISHSDALAYLQPHVDREVRSDQAYDMVHGCAVLEQALEQEHVSHWPWVDTGRAAE